MKETIWKLVWVFIKSPIVLIIPIGILCGIFYKKIIGKVGEHNVSQYLNKLPKKDYAVLNNVMLIDDIGKSHQIDHIVFSKYGIFVIETKNFQGLIKGDSYQKQWVQFLGKNQNNFYNPIHQNYGHIKVLERILNIPERKFIPIVCFSNEARLEVKNNNSVINMRNINDKISEYNKQIIEENINELKIIIEKTSSIGISSKEHVSSIKANLKENEENIKNNICPKCGGKLIKRIGKYGEFLGCVNYPKCKYTYKK